MKSNEFRLSSGKFVLENIFQYGWTWLLGLCAVGLAGLVLGLTVNLYWLMGALFIIFLIIPPSVAFIFYYYGLTDVNALNSLNHTVSVSSSGLTVEWTDKDEKVNGNQTVEYDSNADPAENRAHTRVFEFSCIGTPRTCATGISFPILTGKHNSLWLPVSAFDTPECMESFMEEFERLRAYPTKNVNAGAVDFRGNPAS